jgi:phosphatidylserine/phosphatidylglycerophosphate/cardiolipin synthase-like enzyme
VAAERKLREKTSDRVELVWTGPEMPGSRSRETAVVARELFAKANRSVLVSSYAVFLGKEVFEPLAKRMEELPGLRVLLFLNVPAPGGTDLDPDAVARDYYREFLKKNWPAARQPELYYDPRSLAPKGDERGVIHAKCIVVDGHTALVTSANFTEAAHARNIEAGVVVHDAGFAESLEKQFTSLVAAGALVRVHV